MITEKITELKKRLDKEVEQNYPYDQILKTSKEIDELLALYYLEKINDIT